MAIHTVNLEDEGPYFSNISQIILAGSGRHGIRKKVTVTIDVFTNAVRYDVIVVDSTGNVSRSITKPTFNNERLVDVSINSDRYPVYKFKGTACVKCGLQGKFFAIEKHPNDKTTKICLRSYQ